MVVKTAGTSQGGELFILKMRSFRLGDLGNVMAHSIAPKLGKEQIDIRMTNLVQGEKLHEDLLNDIDGNNLYENNEMFLVPPKTSEENLKDKYPGFVKSEARDYRSNMVQILNEDELSNIITEYVKKIYNINIE